MKLITLPKSGLALCAVLLSATSFSQIQESPIKGQWGLSTGLTLDSYKMDLVPYNRSKQLGILPMLTYTKGKNQFELGPQFSLANTRQNHRYFGANFNYKRYFNGFGNSFVPYFFSGIGFSTTHSNTVKEVGEGVIVASYPYNYRQTGVNLSIGYGLEWQMGKGFYLGSSVSFSTGIYSIRRSDFMYSDSYLGASNRTNQTAIKFDFNVNMQFGYRFGRK